MRRLVPLTFTQGVSSQAPAPENGSYGDDEHYEGHHNNHKSSSEDKGFVPHTRREIALDLLQTCWDSLKFSQGYGQYRYGDSFNR